MPEVSVEERLPLTVERTWELVSDLSRFDEWLGLHEGWRGELPERIEEGTRLTSVVTVKGLRNRVEWHVERFEPPDLVALRGEGKGGTKASLRLSATGDGDTTRVELAAEFSAPALVGPLGRVASRGLERELKRSLEELERIAS